VHICTHWTWPGREGQPIYTKVYSNCDEVELFLNGKSMGRKTMPKLTSAVWEIPYKAGVLLAKGYKNGKAAVIDKVETSGNAVGITIEKHLYANEVTGGKSAVVNISIIDAKNRVVPLASNNLVFEVNGPGKIIAVGNGDPSSHDPETVTETIKTEKITGASMAFVTSEALAVKNMADLSWQHFQQTNVVNKPASDTLIAVKASFNLPFLNANDVYTYFAKNIASRQSVYVNGTLIGKNTGADNSPTQYTLPQGILKQGDNKVLIIGQPFIRRNSWEEINTYPGIIQVVAPAPQWRRKAFNGLAQVLLLLDGDKQGNIELKVSADGLPAANVELMGK
jgi:beta-galactosidase